MTLTTTTIDVSAQPEKGPSGSSLPVTTEHQTAPRAGRVARRTFTNEFKRAVVEEYDAAPVGTKGAVLRRERLYDSHVKEGRAAIEAGTLGDVANKKPAGRRKPRNRPGSLSLSGNW